MKSGVRLAKAAGKAAVCALTLGVVLAAIAVLVIRNLHVGCTVVKSTDGDSLSCPDGIGYLFPGLVIMSLTGLATLIFFVHSEFRGVPPLERERVARLMATWIGGVCALLGGALLVLSLVQSADPDPLAWRISAGGLVAELLAVFGAIALCLCQWTGRSVAIVACIIFAVALLGLGVYSFIGLPFLIVPAAFLLAAANLRRTVASLPDRATAEKARR